MKNERIMTKLEAMPTAQLEAMYNAASRNFHNDIDPGTHAAMMAFIEIVISARRLFIEGEIGSYEFNHADTSRYYVNRNNGS